MGRGIMKRIDIDLDSTVKEMSKKLKLGYRETTREIARSIRNTPRFKSNEINF